MAYYKLEQLTTGELFRARDACDYLMSLHAAQDCLEPKLILRLETLAADLLTIFEDRSATDQQARAAAVALQAQFEARAKLMRDAS